MKNDPAMLEALTKEMERKAMLLTKQGYSLREVAAMVQKEVFERMGIR